MVSCVLHHRAPNLKSHSGGVKCPSPASGCNVSSPNTGRPQSYKSAFSYLSSSSPGKALRTYPECPHLTELCSPMQVRLGSDDSPPLLLQRAVSPTQKQTSHMSLGYRVALYSWPRPSQQGKDTNPSHHFSASRNGSYRWAIGNLKVRRSKSKCSPILFCPSP